MTIAQSLTAVIVFWALIGGVGASLLLPGMQSLIHGNFEGGRRRRCTRWSVPRRRSPPRSAAARRLHHDLPVVAGGVRAGGGDHRVVLSGLGMVRDAPYTGPRGVDIVGAGALGPRMGGVVLGILVWQEGGEYVGALIAGGDAALTGLAFWLQAPQAPRQAALLDIGSSIASRSGSASPSSCCSRSPWRHDDRPAHLPADGARVQRDGGRAHDRPLSEHVRGRPPRRPPRRRAPSSAIIRAGFAALAVGLVALIPIVPHAGSGWALTLPLLVAGSGLGLLVSQLNNYTLAPISEERVSEAAGVNSACGSFGSRWVGVRGAIMLASLSLIFTNMANSSDVLPADSKAQVAQVLEDDAEVRATLDSGAPRRPAAEIRDEVVRINTEAPAPGAGRSRC